MKKYFRDIQVSGSRGNKCTTVSRMRKSYNDASAVLIEGISREKRNLMLQEKLSPFEVTKSVMADPEGSTVGDLLFFKWEFCQQPQRPRQHDDVTNDKDIVSRTHEGHSTSREPRFGVQ